MVVMSLTEGARQERQQQQQQNRSSSSRCSHQEGTYQQGLFTTSHSRDRELHCMACHGMAHAPGGMINPGTLATSAAEWDFLQQQQQQHSSSINSTRSSSTRSSSIHSDSCSSQSNVV